MAQNAIAAYPGCGIIDAMQRLLLVRHGETAWNASGRFQGQTDIPLNSVGRQQATIVADRLASESIDVIYSSDLVRAYETAQTIAAPLGLDVKPDPRLREINYGEWQGLTHTQISERFPEQFVRWNADPFMYAPASGETVAQAAARLQAVLADLPRNHPDQTVLLVAHGGPIRILVCLLLKKSLHEFWQLNVGGNTALTEFVRYRDLGLRMTAYNDTSHLGIQETGHKKQDAVQQRRIKDQI